MSRANGVRGEAVNEWRERWRKTREGALVRVLDDTGEGGESE